jgi:sugar (pentulose or hexulose) kinase
MGFFKAGMALRRFLRLLGVEQVGEQRDELDGEALASRPGTVEVDGMASDVQSVKGIDEDVSRGAVWAAAQTAAARETARILDEMGSLAGPRGRLLGSGGWTRSSAYRAIKHRVLGPFEVPTVTEAGARGAALFAGLAAGSYGSLDEFPAPPTERI